MHVTVPKTVSTRQNILDELLLKNSRMQSEKCRNKCNLELFH
jgi:hypothetical protein